MLSNKPWWIQRNSRPWHAIGLLWVSLWLLTHPGLNRLAAETPLADKAATPQTSVADSGSVEVKANVEKALAVPRLDDQLRNLSQVGEALSLAEIPEALALIDTLPRLRDRSVFRVATMKRWAKLEPSEAFASIAKLPESRDKLELIAYAAVRLTKKDPTAASEAVKTIPPGRANCAAIESVGSAWAEIDPVKAAAWAESLPFGLAKESALHNIRFIWVHSDPISAEKHVAATVERGDIKNALLTNIAAEWAVIDSAAAIQWASGLTDDVEKEVALTNIAEAWADNDPTAAVSFAMDLSPSLVAQRTTAAVIERWATQDPEKAANWVAKENDLTLQTQCLESLFRVWTAVSPAQSGKWVENLPIGDFKAAAIKSYVGSAMAWAPDLCVKLVVQCDKNLVSEPVVEECGREWLQLDPLNAARWISESNLTEATKARWASPKTLPHRAQNPKNSDASLGK